MLCFVRRARTYPQNELALRGHPAQALACPYRAMLRGNRDSRISCVRRYYFLSISSCLPSSSEWAKRKFPELLVGGSNPPSPTSTILNEY